MQNRWVGTLIQHQPLHSISLVIDRVDKEEKKRVQGNMVGSPKAGCSIRNTRPQGKHRAELKGTIDG
jgi:hypothetical protein